MPIDKLLSEPNAYEAICNKLKEDPTYLKKVFDAIEKNNQKLYNLLKNQEDGTEDKSDSEIMALVQENNLLTVAMSDHNCLRKFIAIPRPTGEELRRLFDLSYLKQKYLNNRKQYSLDECKKKLEELGSIAMLTASIIEENKEDCHILILSNYVKFTDIARDIQSSDDLIKSIPNQLPEEHDKAMIKMQQWMDKRFPIAAQIKKDKQHLL